MERSTPTGHGHEKGYQADKCKMSHEECDSRRWQFQGYHAYQQKGPVGLGYPETIDSGAFG